MSNEEPLFSQFEEDPLFDYELENDLLLMKLRAEFGGNPEFVGDDEESELDAPLKYELLKSIYSFEQNLHAPHVSISLFEHLGEPYLVDEKYLTDEGISSQLQRIRRIMKEKQLVLDTVYATDDRTLYRFIVEELLQERTEQNLLPGFYRHFIYEEFHPNHKRDIEEQTLQFFQQLADQTLSGSVFYLSEEIVVGDILLTREEAVNRLMLFAGLFASLEIKNLEISSIEIKPEHAVVDYRICYNGVVSSDEVVEVDQLGRIGYVYRDHLVWQIDSLDIPGVAF